MKRCVDALFLYPVLIKSQQPSSDFVFFLILALLNKIFAILFPLDKRGNVLQASVYPFGLWAALFDRR